MTLNGMRYYIIAFFSGTAVLVIETIGVRILAPYLGAAYIVWVNIIGVILAALAAGYWVGGVAADRTKKLLSPLFFFSAVAVSIIPFARHALPMLGEQLGIRMGSFIASLMLFAPASMLLGMVTPYLVKLATVDPGRIGEYSGSIFAASTIGSIVATFSTGFLLIPNFSTTQILWGVVALLLALAAYTSLPVKAVKAPLALVPLALLFFETLGPSASARLLYEKDSQYYNIRVVERPAFGIQQRVLLLDGSTQSTKLVGPGGPEDSRFDGKADYLVFPYIRLSALLIDAFKPAPARMLAIGGGAYSIPEYVQARYPASDITVAEIDPEVTAAAKRFLRTVEADGRIFLHDSVGRYDLIYTDAYNGAFSVPWHLASREALTAMREALSDDGVLIVNIASSPEGATSSFFRAFWKTFEGLFPQSAVFATNRDFPGEVQNIIVLALKSKGTVFEKDLAAFELYRYRRTVVTSDVPMLTDDYAPTDSLIESHYIRLCEPTWSRKDFFPEALQPDHPRAPMRACPSILTASYILG
jgi:spermidine synthase